MSVLGHPSADLAPRDEQDGLGAAHRLVERHAVVEVGATHLHTAFGQVCQGVRPAPDRHDLVRRNTPAQEVLDDKTPQVAGCPGDDDRHGEFLPRAVLETNLRHRRGPDASGPSGRGS